MADLSLSLLGSPQIALDAVPITSFAYAKVLALLAYLAVEADRPHRREFMVALLWPDQPERAARHSLSQALWRLGQTVGRRTETPAGHGAREPFLLITHDSLQFNRRSDHWLDVTAFTALLAACETHAHRHAVTCTLCAQHLAEAVSLYRGSFLDQFYLNDSQPFEEWAALKREQLHQQVIEALAQLAEYYQRRGEYELAQRYARRQLEMDPWCEEAHRQLMCALWMAGQRSAALAQYEQCCRLLWQELGVEPARETTALYECIRDAGRDPRAGEERPVLPGETAGVEPAAGWRPQTLPAATTPFVGREAELAQLAGLLQDPACRLITLVGPGGIGKTRLALQAAADQAGSFADVYFVPLTALRSAGLILPSIAAALGVVPEGGADLKMQLMNYLREKDLLLVLDNFEHLLGEEPGTAADLLVELLRWTPGLTLLVTSRERLRLAGEWTVELEGLAYPGPEQVAESETYSAVRLFVQSARRVHGSFSLTPDTLPHVAKVCVLVEGMPLAIQLAASWVRVLACFEIAEEIAQSLGFLTTSLRDLPARHQSMHAVFDHSWSLLSWHEQQVLRQLAIFHGGFGREAAAYVTGATLPSLGGLVDKSLVRSVVQPDGRLRYGLHELVRHYASAHLEAAGETVETRLRHLRYFLALAEEAELLGARQATWLAALEEEHDNLRAALEWSLERREADAALRLTGALWWFWWVRGHVSEGRGWLDKALALAGPAPAAVRAKALHGAGWLALQPRDYVRATLLLEQSLTCAREVQDMERIATVLHDLGQAARLQGDHRRAVAVFKESALLGRDLGNRRVEALSLGDIGLTLHAVGDDGQALPFLEAGLALVREVGDNVYLAWFLSFRGRAAKNQRDYARGAVCLAESITLFRDMANKDGIAFALEGFAGLAAAQEDPRRAARLFGAAAALREAINSPMAPIDELEYDRDLAAARPQLDASAWETAWAEGRALSPEQAIAYALEAASDQFLCHDAVHQR